jgi:AraC family transcriptional regulator of adaptative response / DNA-3-methyladenine glycosylase II
MGLDPQSCYAALRARDPRFDGVFFVGVRTTGVYCRPICPARLPRPDRCDFFAEAALAEQAGYRACFRCRPELAPGNADVDARSRLTALALRRIEAGFLSDGSLEQLGTSLGVTPRHLRRVVEAELGVPLVALVLSRRLALAKQLLHDTHLPITEVAFASGFTSVRRFNAAFQERFSRSPSSLRRGKREATGTGVLSLRLDFRPPLAWAELLGFLQGRAVEGVEHVDAERGEYLRTTQLGAQHGWIRVGPVPGRNALRATISSSLSPHLMEVVTRLRALFDLDARPDVVREHLSGDPLLRPLLAQRPGLRVPGAFDGFELAVRAVLGQQVSVRAATTLCARLVERFGDAMPEAPRPLRRLFPSVARLAEATTADIRAIGLPERRAQTLSALARAIRDGQVDLRGGAAPESVMQSLQQLPGIGPWTAHYLAMRALRWPDAFPAGDLILQRRVGVTSARAAEERAKPWQPWRAYAVIHLWQAPPPPAPSEPS